MRSAIPAWAARYVGIPFVERGRSRLGCDCWGLVRLVLTEQFGISAPILDDGYETLTDRQLIAAIMDKESSRWQPIDFGHETEGDVLTMFRPDPVTRHRIECHCGVVIAKGWMLHIERTVNATIEAYLNPKHINRIAHFYRWSADHA